MVIALFDKSEAYDSSSRHIVFIQFGNYAEAVYRFAAGGKEDYYAQKYTVEHVARLVANHTATTVITFSCAYPFEVLPNGVGAQGVLLYPPNSRARDSDLLRALEERQPTDIILAAPIRSVLRWAIRHRVRTLPLFADSFAMSGLKGRLKARVLARKLNNRHFRWVANHNIAAAQNLADIGVDRNKVLPFDWPPLVFPSEYQSKEPPNGLPFKLFYAGVLTETKGIGDVIRALPSLPECRLEVAGSGADEHIFRALAKENGTATQVIFHGKISHEEVVKKMRIHDAVLVPSRHEYPEGLPMTIYEALCVRTPVIASDHPMFLRRLIPGRNAMIFEASKPASLAAAVRRLMDDPELYTSLSKAAGEATEDYLCPLKWHDLIDTWLNGGTEGDAYLSSFSLGRWM